MLLLPCGFIFNHTVVHLNPKHTKRLENFAKWQNFDKFGHTGYNELVRRRYYQCSRYLWYRAPLCARNRYEKERVRVMKGTERYTYLGVKWNGRQLKEPSSFIRTLSLPSNSLSHIHLFSLSLCLSPTQSGLHGHTYTYMYCTYTNSLHFYTYMYCTH